MVAFIWNFSPQWKIVFQLNFAKPHAFSLSSQHWGKLAASFYFSKDSMTALMLFKAAMELFCIGVKKLIFTFHLTVNVLFWTAEAVCNCCHHWSLARWLLRGSSREQIWRFTTGNQITWESLHKGKGKTEKHLSVSKGSITALRGCSFPGVQKEEERVIIITSIIITTNHQC